MTTDSGLATTAPAVAVGSIRQSAARVFGQYFDDLVLTTFEDVRHDVGERPVSFVGVTAEPGALETVRWAMTAAEADPSLVVAVEIPEDHGLNHELPPHAIPYRANLWAMKELGVRRIIGPNASGALKAELELGEFVVCDQFVDRTSGRGDTFYDGPETTHVSAADPFCPDLRTLLVETAGELGIKARDGGTVVVVQGPRFSTRAESKWFQEMGWDTI